MNEDIELNRKRKGERRKAHVNFTTTLFSYKPVEKKKKKTKQEG